MLTALLYKEDCDLRHLPRVSRLNYGPSPGLCGQVDKANLVKMTKLNNTCHGDLAFRPLCLT